MMDIASAPGVGAAALALTIALARSADDSSLETDGNCAVDIVANEARDQPVRCAVSTSLGFGGNDSAIVMRSV